MNYCNRYYHLQFLYLYTDIKVGEKKFVDRVFKVKQFHPLMNNNRLS